MRPIIYLPNSYLFSYLPTTYGWDLLSTYLVVTYFLTYLCMRPIIYLPTSYLFSYLPTYIWDLFSYRIGYQGETKY
jgi:hypothetical protein